MRQYLDAVKQVLEEGTRKENRTGVDTFSTFGIHYKIDLQRGFPLLTTKAMSWKNIVVEMLWFLSGRTDIGFLHKHNCKFWDAWADKETGKVPSAYGNFWRHFPVHQKRTAVNSGAESSTLPYEIVEASFNDQLAWVVEELKRNPMSRRMVVSAWAPENAQNSTLPPCHCLFLVNVQNVRAIAPHPEGLGGTVRVTERRLCLHLTQRSCDIALGVPYNIASYALLMHLLGRFSGIPVGTFSHLLADAHAYTCKEDGSMADMDHVRGLYEQIKREPRPLPLLYIDSSIRSLDDVPRLLELGTDELMALFKLDGYDPHPAINFKVAV